MSASFVHLEGDVGNLRPTISDIEELLSYTFRTPTIDETCLVFPRALLGRLMFREAGEARSREEFAGGKGTGGTPLIDFLKPLKEDSRAAFLNK